MAEQLLINVKPFETRVALLSDGALQELHLARSDGYSLTGNIYLGRVERIVPGMQAAFVNVGLERPGFLHVGDVEGPTLMLGDEVRQPADIRQLLHEGQEIMVQVAKDPISGKGARLTCQLAVASRYLVIMPFTDRIGISQRIEDPEERGRLGDLMDQLRQRHETSSGFIIRTAAEGVSADLIDMDIQVLAGIWQRILHKRRDVPSPGVIYQEIPLHIRIVRDLAGPQLQCIYIDDLHTFQRVRDFVEDFLPQFTERLNLYEERRPLFERFGLEEELDRALSRKVPLKSGGHMVIEQTEAMITVDVNTGGYLGTSRLEETVFRTNLEAAQSLPRQLRLRNLGGIIVVDFIDMGDPEHQRQVLRTLEKACETDPARIRIEGFSSLGLVQMSRKRTRESLLQQACEACSECAGQGVVKTAQTTCVEVFRAILQDLPARCGSDSRLGSGEYLIRATEDVVGRLLDEDADQLAWVSGEIGRDVRIEVEPSYGPGQFDIMLVQDMRRPA